MERAGLRGGGGVPGERRAQRCAGPALRRRAAVGVVPLRRGARGHVGRRAGRAGRGRAGRGGAGQGCARAARPHGEPAAHPARAAATSSASRRTPSSPPSWRWPTSRASRAAGVAACVKHLVANDQEHDRFEVSSEPDERTLREVSLLPFEHALRRAGAWSTMAAYNRLHGTHCSQHERLLTTILRDEWGWDGVVISDWFAVHATVEPALAGLDLEMPGPPLHWGAAPGRARSTTGEVPVEVIEAKRERLALLGRRTGADRAPAGRRGGRRFRRARSRWPGRRRRRRSCCCATRACCRCRRACGGSRWSGPNGDREVIQGGGSARVTPTDVATVADGLRERLGDGVVVEPGPAPAAAHRPWRAPTCAAPTARSASTSRSSVTTVRCAPRLRPRDFRVLFLDDPGDATDAGWSARASATFTPRATGVAPVQGEDQRRGHAHRRRRDGRPTRRADRRRAGARSSWSAGSTIRASDWRPSCGARRRSRPTRSSGRSPPPATPRPPSWSSASTATGRPRDATASRSPCPAGRSSWSRPWPPPSRGPSWWCWPARRSTCRGHRRCRRVLWGWFPGQEGGRALADVLFGDAEPGGRLPCTIPRAHRGHAVVPRRRARRAPLPRGRLHRAPLVRRPGDRAGVPVRLRPGLHDLGGRHPGGAAADRRRGGRRGPGAGRQHRRPARAAGSCSSTSATPSAGAPARSGSCAPSRRWRWIRRGAGARPSCSACATSPAGTPRQASGWRSRRAPRVGGHVVAATSASRRPSCSPSGGPPRLGAGPTVSSVAAGAPDRAAPLRRPGLRRRPDPARAGDGPGAVGVPRRPVRAGGGVPPDRRPPPDVRAAVVAVRPGADLARRPAGGVGRRRRDRGRPHRRRAGLRPPRGRHRLRDRVAGAGRARPCRRAATWRCWRSTRWARGAGSSGGWSRRASTRSTCRRRGWAPRCARPTCCCSRRWRWGRPGSSAVSGSLAAATVARHAEVPVWLAAGVGRLLPARMWDALAGRRATRAADPWDLDEEVVPLTSSTRCAGRPASRTRGRRAPPHRLPGRP